MCLIVLAVEAHPQYELVVAANRDEFYSRPTAPASFWPEARGVLAGRDLQAGGTWLGVTKAGRFAALTNVREPGRHRVDAPSRGRLVARFLAGRETPEEFAASLAEEGSVYNGFSLILGIRGELWHVSNRGGRPARLLPGVHGLSNALLDEPWPKVEKGKRALSAALSDDGPIKPGVLLDLLSDREIASEGSLPHTGVGLEAEKALSPIFTRTDQYGTRCSTVLLLDRTGRALFVEVTFDAEGRETGRGRFEFVLESGT